jgi:hypothetical protein
MPEDVDRDRGVVEVEEAAGVLRERKARPGNLPDTGLATQLRHGFVNLP